MEAKNKESTQFPLFPIEPNASSILQKEWHNFRISFYAQKILL